MASAETTNSGSTINFGFNWNYQFYLRLGPSVLVSIETISFGFNWNCQLLLQFETAYVVCWLGICQVHKYCVAS